MIDFYSGPLSLTCLDDNHLELTLGKEGKRKETKKEGKLIFRMNTEDLMIRKSSSYLGWYGMTEKKELWSTEILGNNPSWKDETWGYQLLDWDKIYTWRGFIFLRLENYHNSVQVNLMSENTLMIKARFLASTLKNMNRDCIKLIF